LKIIKYIPTLKLFYKRESYRCEAEDSSFTHLTEFILGKFKYYVYEGTPSPMLKRPSIYE